jgi:hypothetical protein
MTTAAHTRIPVAGATWQRGAPPWIRRLATLSNPDYVDFVAATAAEPPELPPQQWIEHLLRTLTPSARRLLRLTVAIQRALLGMRTPQQQDEERPTPIPGWRLVAAHDTWFALQASSNLLTGHIVFHVDGRFVSGATFVRYERPVARLIWIPVSRIHRRVALAIVRYAAARPCGESR